TETDYVLDGVHNRIEVDSIESPANLHPDGTDPAGALVGEYLLTGDNALNNQYSAGPTKVYAYDLAGSQTLRADLRRADFDGSYLTDVNDLLAFLGAHRDGDLSADMNGDEQLTEVDIALFLAMFRDY